MEHVIDDPRCTQIASAARALWCEFLDMNPQYTGLSLLSSRVSHVRPLVPHAAPRPQVGASFPRNECAEAFFTHCAETMARVPSIVINQVSLKGWMPDVHGRPASWLVHFPGLTTVYEDTHRVQRTELKPHAIVLIDLDYLLSQVRRGSVDAVWTGLLLHETGHLVLHWDDFDHQRVAGSISMATAVQEAEAWYFQSCVMGLALGSYAHGCVSDPRRGQQDYHEDAWNFI